MDHSSRREIKRLILIYAADSGKLAAVMDSTRKLLGLKACALCSITHGILGEKPEWRNCAQDLGIPVDYWHRDGMPEELRQTIGEHLPCVLAEVEGRMILLLSQAILEQCSGSVDELKSQLLMQAAVRNLVIPSSDTPA